MAQDNQIIAEIIVEGADQFKAQLQSSRKEVQAFDDDQKELNNTLAEAKNKLKDLETQGKANTAEYKKLENETRAVEISMQSQGKATDSLRTQQRKLKEEYADLRIKMEQLEKANLKGTDSYKLLEQRMQVVQQEAGSLNDLMGDVSSEISQLGSDTRGLDKAIRVTNTVVAGFSLAQGAAGLFGGENENLQKTLLKVNSAMLVLNGLQQIQEEITKKDSLFTTAATKAKELYTAAMYGASRATQILYGVMTGGLLIVLGLALTYWKEIAEAIGINIDNSEKLAEVQERLKKIEEDRKALNDAELRYLKAKGESQDVILKKELVLAEQEHKKLLQEIEFAKDITKLGLNKNDPAYFYKAKKAKEKEIEIEKQYQVQLLNSKSKILEIKKALDDFNTKKDDKPKSLKVVLNELEKLKAELQKKQKELETEVSKLVVKEGKTESKLSIDLRAKITGIKEQIRVIENLINGNPLELKAKFDFEQNLKRSIDEAKAKFRDLFNIIFESGGDVATDPELKAQAEKIKILEQQLEDALKLYDDYFKEAEEKATYSNEQIFTIEQEKTKLLRNEYLTRLDELTNFYNEGLISEQEYNEAVKDLGEQRNATLQENIGKATEIFGYLNQVATEASQLATDIIQQNAEKELATLDDKKKRGVISEKQYEKEVAKVKNEQARKQKAVETAQAFLKVPQVILNTLAQVPFPANLVLAPILGALALAQAIRVAKAPLPKFRDGGFADRIFKGSGKVVGKSHAQGGVNAELEGNEYVMQGKAVSFYGQDFMKAVNNMNYQPPTLKTKDIYYPKEDKLSSKLDLIASYTKQSYKTVEKSNQLLSSINQNTKTGKNARV